MSNNMRRFVVAVAVLTVLGALINALGRSESGTTLTANTKSTMKPLKRAALQRHQNRIWREFAQKVGRTALAYAEATSVDASRQPAVAVVVKTPQQPVPAEPQSPTAPQAFATAEVSAEAADNAAQFTPDTTSSPATSNVDYLPPSMRGKTQDDAAATKPKPKPKRAVQQAGDTRARVLYRTNQTSNYYSGWGGW